MIEVNVTSSSTGPGQAGAVVVLTCLSASDRLPQLTWEGPSGPVSSGSGITVLEEQERENNTARSALIFSPLQTSHAGAYTCASNIESGFKTKTYTSHLYVKGTPVHHPPQ